MKEQAEDITCADIAYCAFEELLLYRSMLSGKLDVVSMTKNSFITNRLMNEFNSGERIFIQ